MADFTIIDLRNWVQAARDTVVNVADGIGVIRDTYSSYKGHKVAGSLDTIAFKSNKSRRHLERIAEGKGSFDDFQMIGRIMDETGGQVETALDRLHDHRDYVRKKFGMAVANRIDDLVYAGGGKASIRFDLIRLSGMDHEMYTSDEVVAEAKLILANIEKLNTALVALHDEVLKIKGTGVE